MSLQREFGKEFLRQMSLPTASIPPCFESVIPVLLVIARDLDRSRSRGEINPATIQCALLKTQQKTCLAEKPYRIHLEVVRPGSMGELKKHLRKRNNKHFFRVVHFDLHGEVEWVTLVLLL